MAVSPSLYEGKRSDEEEDEEDANARLSFTFLTRFSLLSGRRMSFSPLFSLPSLFISELRRVAAKSTASSRDEG